MTLTKREISKLIRLLGVLQTNLESAIDSSTLADGSFDRYATPGLKRDIAACRREWKQAEEFVKKFEAARRAKR